MTIEILDEHAISSMIIMFFVACVFYYVYKRDEKEERLKYQKYMQSIGEPYEI